MGDKFEGRMLLHLFASSFTEDSYLRVQLTSQVSLQCKLCMSAPSLFQIFLISQDFRFLGRQLCSVLLGLGVLRPATGQDNVFKVTFQISHHRAGLVILQIIQWGVDIVGHTCYRVSGHWSRVGQKSVESLLRLLPNLVEILKREIRRWQRK